MHTIRSTFWTREGQFEQKSVEAVGISAKALLGKDNDFFFTIKSRPESIYFRNRKELLETKRKTIWINNKGIEVHIFPLSEFHKKCSDQATLF